MDSVGFAGLASASHGFAGLARALQGFARLARLAGFIVLRRRDPS